MAESVNSTSEGAKIFENPESILKRMEENVSLGERMNPQTFTKDVISLHLTGATEKPEVLELLRTLGAHPPIWTSVLDFLERSITEANPQDLSDYLQIGRDLGMDQNPDIKPLFIQLHDRLLISSETKGSSITPEVSQTDEEKAKEFLAQIQEASKRIDDQQNATNLQTMKGLAGFREINQAIQNLSLDLSREDFILSAQDVLNLKGISEKLAEELEDAGGWDKGEHQNNIATVALALTLEITNRASQISGFTSTAEQSSPEPVQPPPETPPSPPAAAPLSPEVPPPEPANLPEAPTLFGDNSPFIKTIEKEAGEKWQEIVKQDYLKYYPGGWEEFLEEFVQFQARERTGITGTVEITEYLSSGYLPKGLGGWIPQRSDLEANSPKQPGQWVIEPKPGSLIAIKVAGPNPAQRSQLSFERATYLQINQLFDEHSWTRPAKLYGYGLDEQDKPYLLLEAISGNFQRLDYLLSSQGGSLNEATAVKIAYAIGIVVNQIHGKGYIYNDLSQDKLENFFWDPNNEQFRIIDFGNTLYKEGEIEKNLPTSYGHDRQGLGNLLFRLITGKRFPNNRNNAISDLAEMNPTTRLFVERACYMAREGENYNFRISEDSNRMLADLVMAWSATAGSNRKNQN